MPADAILVEYAVLPDHLLAWTVRRGVLAMTEIPISEEILSREVQALRSSIDGHRPDSEIQRSAGALHSVLLEPLLLGLPREAPLIVVPDRFLVQVPFAALFDRRRGRYVVEDRTVAVAPSATLYLVSSQRAQSLRGGRQTMLAVGDPAFDRELHPRLSRLPEASQEAVEVASLYPGSDLLRFGAATREASLAGAGAHRIVHFGGHALLHPTSPRLNRLVFAPGAGPDTLSAQEIASLRLPQIGIVVLSACRTLPGGRERESLNGLAAAFLAAGPPVVISNLWNAEDRAARALMTAFYRALRRGLSPAASLREAQLHLLRGPNNAFHSPSAWGGFAAVGGALE